MDIEKIYEMLGLGFVNDPLSQKLAEEDGRFSKVLGSIKRAVENYKSLIEQGISLFEEHHMQKLERPLIELAVFLSSNEQSIKKLVEENEFNEYNKKVVDAKNNFGDNLWVLSTYASELENKGLLNISQSEKEEPSDSSYEDEIDVIKEALPSNPEQNPFKEVYDKLVSLKTFSSSRSYRGIISMLEFAMENENWESGKDLKPEERYISKLLAIKSSINKYINHKAEDGVKQNVFKKLAAVEELNRLVENCLSKVKFESFEYGDTVVKRENYELSFEEEVKAAKYKKFRNEKYKHYTPVTEKEAKLQKMVVADKYPEATANEIMYADGCMARIILSALNHRDVPEKVLDEHFKNQKELFNNPANEKVAEKATPSVSAPKI